MMTSNNKSSVLHEITPLSERDCIYVIERNKTEFNYPIHTHREFEINYIENAAGAQRIVGDSIEEIGDYELVLISNDHLEHGWQNHHLKPTIIREITIQFSPDLLDGSLAGKTQFRSIVNLLQQGKRGIAFSRNDILDIRPIIMDLAKNKEGFDSVVKFLQLLNAMSTARSQRTLSSTSFAQVTDNFDSRRVTKVMEYLNEHYASPIKLKEVADMVNLSVSTLSKLIKRHTGKNFIDCLNSIRLGYAIRQMSDNPTQPISEIAYMSGFNNLSNFNRTFLKKKGCTPKEFRENYAKRKIII